MKLGNYDQEPINYEGIASENIDAYENFVGRVSHMINRMPDTPLKFLLYHMALDQNLREEYFNDWVRAGREVGSINPFGFIIRSFQVLFPHKDERGEVIEDGKDRILAIDELYKRQNPGLAISPFKTGIYGIQNIVVDGGLMHRTRCWVLYFKAVDADGVSRKKPEYILWTEDSDKDLYYSAHQYIKPYNSSHVEGEINRAINRGEGRLILPRDMVMYLYGKRQAEENAGRKINVSRRIIDNAEVEGETFDLNQERSDESLKKEFQKVWHEVMEVLIRRTGLPDNTLSVLNGFVPSFESILNKWLELGDTEKFQRNLDLFFSLLDHPVREIAGSHKETLVRKFPDFTLRFEPIEGTNDGSFNFIVRVDKAHIFVLSVNAKDKSIWIGDKGFTR